MENGLETLIEGLKSKLIGEGVTIFTEKECKSVKFENDMVNINFEKGQISSDFVVFSNFGPGKTRN